MTKHHTIEVSELQHLLETEDITLVSSSRERKKIVSTLKGGLKVIVAGVTIWEGIQPFPCIEAYNKITEKYIDLSKNFKI